MAKLTDKFELGDGLGIEGAKVRVFEADGETPANLFKDPDMEVAVGFVLTDRFGRYVAYVPTGVYTVKIAYGDQEYVFESIDVVAAADAGGGGGGGDYDPANVEITGGTIDGVNIGGTDPGAGTFTTLESADGLVVNSIQVIGEQGAAIADPTGGATTDAEARTSIGLILTALRTHGLIAT